MEIDWSVFDDFPESTCECMCGISFRSHVKFVMVEPRGLRSRKQCPKCGGTSMRRAMSDVESFIIKR